MDQEEKILSILTENLKLLNDRTDISAEQRQICLSLLLSHIIKNTPKDADIPQIYKKFVVGCGSAGGGEKIQFCKALLSFDEELCHTSLALPFSETAPGSHGKIAYVRNNYNDNAFSLFSNSVPNAKPLIMSSFTDACEEVLDNRCEFCIIPVENTSDGRLFGFYSMLDRYDLKIVGACEIETDDNSKSIRYALAGRGISQRAFAAFKKKKEPVLLEFSLVSDDAFFMNDLLVAAKRCNAVPIKVNSLPVSYDDKAERFFFTLKISAEHIYTFILYLSLEFSSFSFIGLYPSKKQKKE